MDHDTFNTYMAYLDLLGEVKMFLLSLSSLTSDIRVISEDGLSFKSIALDRVHKETMRRRGPMRIMALQNIYDIACPVPDPLGKKLKRYFWFYSLQVRKLR